MVRLFKLGRSAPRRSSVPTRQRRCELNVSSSSAVRDCINGLIGPLRSEARSPEGGVRVLRVLAIGNNVGTRSSGSHPPMLSPDVSHTNCCKTPGRQRNSRLCDGWPKIRQHFLHQDIIVLVYADSKLIKVGKVPEELVNRRRLLGVWLLEG